MTGPGKAREAITGLDGRGRSPGGSCRTAASRGSSPCSADEAFRVTGDAVADVARMSGYLWIGEGA